MLRLTSLALACLSIAFAVGRANADDLPKFKDYPVKVFAGKTAKPRFHTQDLRDRRELYQSAVSDEKVNAGGRFIVVKLPCGSACAQPTFLDATNGKIVEFDTVSGWREVSDDFEPVLSRADSRLVVFAGSRNEKGVNGLHFYIIGDNGKLQHLRTVDVGGNFETAPKVQ
ncbi:MAG: hypothetical protein A4S14_08115 [Proteobacteria bacterium SG_bin9]|nr:MAG: hypothetical protein A4S14_08115 [Proteobacteria bacterium SG_bin9]